tara:strand:- start:96 stop:497 length:402 start_codon:yes stop_codon:yes gene_type:complete
MNISDEEYIEYGDEEYKKFKGIFEKKTYLMLCIEEPLDTIISEDKDIVIYDNRKDYYEYSELPDNIKNKYVNYLHIRSNNKPITLKDVLTSMMNDRFYSINNKPMYEYFNHTFLESIYKSKNSNMQYEIFLGS